MKLILNLSNGVHRRLLLSVSCLLLSLPAIPPAGAAIAIVVQGGTFKAADGLNPIPEDALFQLINLGQDELADEVVAEQWLSGDDILIDLIFGIETEYPTSGGFDLAEGEVFSPGLLQRVFDFEITVGVIEPGDKVMLRWWPEYTAQDFHEGFTPKAGDKYGQARIETPVNGAENTSWIIPEEEELTAVFDPLVSQDYADASSVTLIPTTGFDGEAHFSVIPEPVSSAVTGLTVLLFLLRRRQWVVGKK